jgi:mannose-6-phosphate isomerase-like protein (cupin superfamily)
VSKVTPIEKVNIAQKFSLFSEHWSPKEAARVNDTSVRLAKLKGEFVWHHHEHEDELFLVVKGRLLLKLRDKDIWLEEGEFVVIPRGVEHLPIAEEEVHLILFEPVSTVNTGTVQNERTVEIGTI